jgi:hypothetical protein
LGKSLNTICDIYKWGEKERMDAAKIVIGAISIIIGLVLLPVMAVFTATAKADPNVSAVSGLSSLLDLVLYGFTFGLVGLGVGLIWIGFKHG